MAKRTKKQSGLRSAQADSQIKTTYTYSWPVPKDREPRKANRPATTASRTAK